MARASFFSLFLNKIKSIRITGKSGRQAPDLNDGGSDGDEGEDDGYDPQVEQISHLVEPEDVEEAVVRLEPELEVALNRGFN